MTTVRDIVERAYRKVGIAASDEAITGDMALEGLNAFNAMVAGWALHGIDTGTSDADLSDPFPLEAKFVDATVYLLAEKIAPDFTVPAPFADDAMRAIQAAYLVIDEAEMPSVLRHRQWRY